MAREKTLTLIITFPTTTAAMAMEAACGPDMGRLIPVPAQVSAGCGLAWCAPPEHEEALLSVMERGGIRYEEVHRIMLY